MTTQMKESVSVWPSSSRAFRPDTSPDVERRIRVAFVEDDDDYREAVSNELGDHGFDVTAFCDGTALLAAFAAGAEAEIILLDWSLPSVSGIDLIPRLRRSGVAGGSESAMSPPVATRSISMASSAAYTRSGVIA